MSEGRNTADGKTGARAHEIGIRAPEAAADERRELLFVGTIHAADHGKQRTIRLLKSEDEGLGNLGHVAADRSSSFFCRARTGRKFPDHECKPLPVQCLLNPPCCGRQDAVIHEASSRLWRVAAATALVISC